MIDTKLRPHVQKFFDWAAVFFIRRGIGPSALTWAAGILGWGAAAALAFGSPFARTLCLILAAFSAFFDILDGTVARKTGTSSPLGGFLDLVLDRSVEIAFVLAYVIAYPAATWGVLIFLSLVIINFSIFLLAGSLFPNTGKKAMHYEGGLVERTETFILFGLMVIFPSQGPLMLWIFSGLMAFTAGRRFCRIVSFARKNGLDEAGARRKGSEEQDS